MKDRVAGELVCHCCRAYEPNKTAMSYEQPKDTAPAWSTADVEVFRGKLRWSDHVASLDGEMGKQVKHHLHYLTCIFSISFPCISRAYESCRKYLLFLSEFHFSNWCWQYWSFMSNNLFSQNLSSQTRSSAVTHISHCILHIYIYIFISIKVFVYMFVFWTELLVHKN